VSLFIDPTRESIDRARHLGVAAIELHTGRYAHAWPRSEAALAELKDTAAHARSHGLAVHAGHGLTYRNVTAVAAVPEIEELNIGHSIVSRALMVGMARPWPRCDGWWTPPAHPFDPRSDRAYTNDASIRKRMTQPLGIDDFFALEAGEYLDRLSGLAATTGPPSAEELVRFTRALRGSALMANQQAIARAAGGLEHLVRSYRDGRRAWDRDMAALFREAPTSALR
jgi:hypothetical protein